MSTILEHGPAIGAAGLAQSDAGDERFARRVLERFGPARTERYFGACVRSNWADDVLVVRVRSAFAASLLGGPGRAALGALAQEAWERVPADVRLMVEEPGPRARAEGAEARAGGRESGAPVARAMARRMVGARARNGGGPLAQFALARFVVGPCNRLAFEASVRLGSLGGTSADGHSGEPAESRHLSAGMARATPRPRGCSLVVLHGPCGLGKTHLVHGTALRHAQVQAGGAGVQGERGIGAGPAIVMSGETFVAEYIGAIRSGRIDAWRRRVRSADLFCLDDVSALIGRVKTQQELVYTLDALAARGAAVCVSAPCSPRELRVAPGGGGKPGLSEALISRLLAGMVVRLEAPDVATREQIARSAAIRRGLELEDEAARMLARRVPDGTSVRELEGIVLRLEAIHRLLQSARVETGGKAPARSRVGCATVEQALGGFERVRPAGERPAGAPSGSSGARFPARPPVRFQTIISAVCAVVGVSEAEVLSSGRHALVVLARALCVLAARETTSMSYPEIARALGRPNHSTVITAFQRIGRQLKDGLVVCLGPGRGEALLSDLAQRVRASVRAA
ncbi:MAG: DnaA/Hda family protein [Phycisphaerales bacterium]